MLVLKRKPNEKIRIGNDIVINIISLTEHQVKIGIEAPDDIKILREEIYENVKQHIVEASQHSVDIVPKEITKLPVNKMNKNK